MLKDLLVKLLKYLTQGAFEATHQEELAAAQAKIKDLEGQVANLETAKAAIMTDYNALSARETAAQNDLQSLQAAYASLQAQQTALEAKIKGIETDAESKKAAVDAGSDTDAFDSLQSKS